jgi:site-specific DNA recombinase
MTRKKQKQTPTAAWRVGAYVRVSTQRQATEGDSLEAQQNVISRYLENRKLQDQRKIDFVRFYIDAGRSAKDQNRPELQRLRADIGKGELDSVICFKLDRITRSILDFADLWEFFAQHGVEFISLHESVDSSTPMGKAMLFIIMVFAQLEREVTGERTRATMQDRITRGLWNGGYVYGYVSSPDDPGKLVPDVEWAKIIRENFFDALERLGSAGAVMRELQEKQIRVPKHKSRSGKIIGGKWFKKQPVMGILRNQIYLGRITWGGLTQENCHEPIVSIEQFERVQAILDRTTEHRCNRHRSRGRGYTLRGLVRCGCGAMMTPKGAHGRGRKYHYYECTKKIHSGGMECDAASIPAESLEEAVAARVAEIGTSEPARKQIIAEALKLIDSNAQTAEQEAICVRNRLVSVKAEIGRLVAVLKEIGTNAPASIRDELVLLEAEKQELSGKLTELLERKTPWDLVMSLAKKFVENWSGVGELIQQATPDERRAILEQFVEVIQLTPSGKGDGSGTYLLRLFSEATPAENGSGRKPHKSENGQSVLTDNPLVRKVDEKAPRIGRFY